MKQNESYLCGENDMASLNGIHMQLIDYVHEREELTSVK